MGQNSITQSAPKWTAITDPDKKSLDVAQNPDGSFTATATSRNGAVGQSTEGTLTSVTASTQEQAQSTALSVSNKAAESGSLSLPTNEPGVSSVQLEVGRQNSPGQFTASSVAQITNPATGQASTLTDESKGSSLQKALLAGNDRISKEGVNTLVQQQTAGQVTLPPGAAQSIIKQINGGTQASSPAQATGAKNDLLTSGDDAQTSGISLQSASAQPSQQVINVDDFNRAKKSLGLP